MNAGITREQAVSLLRKYNQEPFHLQHALTVEGVMRWYARQLGFAEEEDFFDEEDIRFLYQEIRKCSPFEEPDDFLLMSKMPSHNITIGAALVYIRSFLDNIDIKS